jgi:hypothetical protein
LTDSIPSGEPSWPGSCQRFRSYRQEGQSAAAKEHLGTARTMLAQMEMLPWLEQAEVELALT